MNIQYKLTMDLMNPGVMPRVDVVQGDVNTRSIALSLYSGQFLWAIPEAASIYVRYAKPDGTRGVYDTLPDGTAACTWQDNVIEFLLAPQMLTAAGAVQAQVVILQEDAQLATFSLQIHVAGDPSAGSLTSEDYVNWMGTTIRNAVEQVFQEAKEAGALTGPAGKTPTVEAERFSEELREGVRLTVTNPGEGNQLDSVTQVQLFDGADGVTPRFASVDAVTVAHDEAAGAEITGAVNAMQLTLRIPQGEPGADGETPFIKTAGIATTDGRSGTLIQIYDSGSAAEPSQEVRLYNGVDGQQGEPGADGKSPTISTAPIRASDGRMGVQISISNPDGSMYTANVYNGADGEPGVMEPLVLYAVQDNKYPQMYLDDSSYGDEALQAILEGRQILVRVPGKYQVTSDAAAYEQQHTALFSPVLTYHLPNYDNNYLYLFYLRDEKQTLDLSAMGLGIIEMPVYGELKMLLSQTYSECPLAPMTAEDYGDLINEVTS